MRNNALCFLDEVRNVPAPKLQIVTQHGGRKRRLEMAARLTPRAAGDIPVKPARCDRPIAKHRIGDQFEQQRAVGEPGVENDDGVAKGSFEARQGSLARRAEGNHLGQHRIEDGRDDVVLRIARIDAHARPKRCLEVDKPARTRREALVGILGIESCLDGRTPRHWWVFGRQPLPAADIDLQADQVETKDLFGHRVLDLKPGVHLKEVEGLQIRQQQELGRARADIARDACQVCTGFAKGLFDCGGQPGCRRLLQHLLLPALHRTVARPERPHAAVAVGEHLHLDMAGIGDEGLDEDRRVAERGPGLGRSRTIGAGQFVRAVDTPDAAPATAGSGLEQDRVPDPLGAGRSAGFIDRFARPGTDPDAGLLGQTFGRDLVAKRTHGAGRRTQEDHAMGLAGFLQLRPLGGEAPARPQRVGTGLTRQCHDPLDIKVGAALLAVLAANHRFAETDRGRGHAHERRLCVGMGIQGNNAERAAVLARPAERGTNEANCRLATVCHRDT